MCEHGALVVDVDNYRRGVEQGGGSKEAALSEVLGLGGRSTERSGAGAGGGG